MKTGVKGEHKNTVWRTSPGAAALRQFHLLLFCQRSQKNEDKIAEKNEQKKEIKSEKEK